MSSLRGRADAGNLRLTQVVVPSVRAEDERDFESLVAARYDSLRRTAVVLCGDPHHAEDLVQIVFMRLHRSWRRIDAVADLDAYLYVSLVNTYRSWWRRRWHGELPTEAPAQDVVAQRIAEDEADLRDSVVRALRQLGADHREVLVLRFIAGLSESETATALSIAVGTVKSRTSRALAALRSCGLLDEELRSS
jgi:RNA polymerase sigma-70 factor (sigma-E family)